MERHKLSFGRQKINVLLLLGLSEVKAGKSLFMSEIWLRFFTVRDTGLGVINLWIIVKASPRA